MDSELIQIHEPFSSVNTWTLWSSYLRDFFWQRGIFQTNCSPVLFILRLLAGYCAAPSCKAHRRKGGGGEAAAEISPSSEFIHIPFPPPPDDEEFLSLPLCFASPTHLLFSICPVILRWDLLKSFPWEWPWAFFLLLFQHGWLRNRFLLARPPHLLPTLRYLCSSTEEAAAFPGEECSLWQIPHPTTASLLWQAEWESSLHGSNFT